MKKIILILSLICIGLFANAQYVVDFEDASKGGYASGTVTLNGIDWNMTEALIGTATADYYVGTKSARLRGNETSSISMLANKTNGIGNVTFKYRRYGTDIQVDWKVEYSTDGGAIWLPVGSAFTASSTGDTLTFNEDVNITNDARIRIVRATLDGNTTTRRLNIDDITLTDFAGGTTDTIATVSSVDATVLENVGTVTVNFALNQAPVLDKTVDFALISGNAAVLNNYTTQTITFAGGSTTASVVLDVTSGIVTGSEVLTFELSNPSADLVLGTNIDYVLTVNQLPTAIAPCSELFFSEYIEGTSSNKAVEIYNPSTTAIDLTNYSVRVYTNGSSAVSSSLTLTGMLNPGQTYIIANSQVSQDILDVANITSGVMNFNGDDALELFNNSDNRPVDVIGEIGVQPTGSWVVGSGSTADFTLRRMSNIDLGTTTWIGDGDTQWDVFPVNTFDGLAWHKNTTCGASIPVVAEIESITSTCVGSEINFVSQSYGGVAPYSYTWDFGNGDDSTTSLSSLVYSYTNANTYNVILTVADANGTQVTAPITVEIFENPTSSFTTDNVVCSDAITINNASTGNTLTYSYNFSSTLTEDTFDASTGNATYTGTAGGYSITQIVTDVNSCIDSSNVMGTITLAEDASFTINNSICQDAVMMLSANNTLGSWSGNGVTDNSDGTGEFDPSGIAPGMTDITYSIMGLCGSSETNQVAVLETPITNFTSSVTGSTVSFTNTSSNVVFAMAMNWDFGDGTPSSNDFTDPSHTYTANGNYTVCLEIVNGNGCSDEVCQQVTIQGIGVENNSKNAFAFYPNPSNGIITITSDASVQLELINIIGKVLYNNTVSGIRTLDFSNFSKGTYFVRTTLNGVTNTEKLILK